MEDLVVVTARFAMAKENGTGIERIKHSNPRSRLGKI
jgi:hypothetical protein